MADSPGALPLKLACGGAVAGSVGDLLMLWVANAQRQELALPAPGPLVLWTGGLLGVLGIPLYAAGYRAVSQAVRAAPQGIARLIFRAGAGAAGLGALIHGLTAALIHTDLRAETPSRPPLDAVAGWGPGLIALWAIATLLVLAASAGVLRASFSRDALPRRIGWLNPAFATLALAAAGAGSEPGRAFLVPAAPNLAHLIFFGAALSTLRGPAPARAARQR
jgi:hypothetical protein